MFLTPEQLEQLTGYRRPSAQARWLRKRRWMFALRADGRPAVLATEAERQLETGGSRRAPAPVATAEPDFTILRGAG